MLAVRAEAARARDGCGSRAASIASRTNSPTTTTTGAGSGGATTSGGRGARSFLSGPRTRGRWSFLQMTDRRRLRCLSQALYVWHHDEPAAIFRHAAVRHTLPRPARSRRRTARCPPRCGCSWTAMRRACRSGSRSPRTARATTVHAEFRPQSYARLAQPSEVRLGPVDRAVRDQRHRHGDVDPSTVRASTSSAPVYSSSSMAERVSSLLRRSVEHLARRRCPPVTRLVVDESRAAGRRARRRRRALLPARRRAGSRSSTVPRSGRCADRHHPSRHPRRARREGRAAGSRRDGHGVRARARSTTSCARTTPCSRTSTRPCGHRRSPGC